MTDLRYVPTSELEAELRRRTGPTTCLCGRWQTYIGNFDEDGLAIRCRGCMRVIDKCECGT